MRPIAPAMSVLCTAIVCACASLSGDPVASSPGADATVVIRGKYSESSNTARALQQAMAVEATRQCPSGWTTVSDENNPRSLTGGRIWRIRCNPGAAVASDLTTTPPTASRTPSESTARAATTAAAASAPAAATGPGAPAAPTVPAANAPGAMNRADLIRILAAAVRRASPYLTDSAAAAIVAEQLRSLAGAKVGLLGPDGQPL